MNSGEATSVLWLWLLGLAWGLGPWLALALAALLATTASRALHRFARRIETRPVGPEFHGFLGIFRDAILHRAASSTTNTIAAVVTPGIGLAVIAGATSKKSPASCVRNPQRIQPPATMRMMPISASDLVGRTPGLSSQPLPRRPSRATPVASHISLTRNDPDGLRAGLMAARRRTGCQSPVAFQRRRPPSHPRPWRVGHLSPQRVRPGRAGFATETVRGLASGGSGGASERSARSGEPRRRP